MSLNRENSQLELALEIALDAHRGQIDKAGQAYILHPLRVMSRMTSNDTRIVAILHDVVEDSDWTMEQLKSAGFTSEVIAAIECLTKRPDEIYDDFIVRVSSNPVATLVKIGDLEDNMNLDRLCEVSSEDLARISKYRAAWQHLTKL